MENAFIPDQAEISENEHESQTSGQKSQGLFNELEGQVDLEDDSNLNPFEDYEPKNLQVRENLSYASSMNTPRNLAMSSPLNVQQQKRFEKRNIPVTFSSVAKQQDKFNKYNIKELGEAEEIVLTPGLEGRNRRDPLARGSLVLSSEP